MINQILEMLFSWNSNPNSRDCAKSRLKLIIAHDRASINPEMLNSIREEILDVVARYIEVDRDEMEVSLSHNQRITALTANLPILQVKRLAHLMDEVEDRTNDLESDVLDLPEPNIDANNVGSNSN